MKNTIQFSGIDRDTELRFLEPGMYRDALNVLVGTNANEKQGSVVSIPGNTLIPNSTLPSVGENTCIGFKEFRAENVAFFFLYNSAGKHGVYKFDRQTNNITRVFPGDFQQADVLNFHRDNLITGIVYIDNKLSWCDGISDTSNPPREINVVDAANYPRPYKTGEYDKHFQLDYVKMPPTFPLEVELGKDSVSTYLDKKSFQVAYMYIYKDGQKSTWSPLSKLVSAGYSQTWGDTYIKITLNDGRLFKVEENPGRYASHIQYIVFAFKDYPTGPYRTFTRYLLTNLPNPLVFYLKDDESFPVVDPSESSRQYDAVPLLSGAHEIAKNKAFFGDNIEGFANYNLQVSNVSEKYTNLDNAPFNYDHNKFGNYLSFKNNSVYQLGVVFYDRANRSSNVYTLESLKINTPAEWKFLGQVLPMDGTMYWTKYFTIEGQPPVWATHYQVVRTNNQKVSYFAQGVVENVVYVSGYDENGDPIEIKKKIGRPGVVVAGILYAPYKHDWSFPAHEYRFITIDQSANGTYKGAENIFFNPDIDPVIYEGGITNNGQVMNARRDHVSGPFGINGGDFYEATITQRGIPELDSPIGKDFNGNDIYRGGVYASGEPVTNFAPDGLDKAIDVLIDINNWYNTTKYYGKAPVVQAKGTIVLIPESTILPATNYVISEILVDGVNVLANTVTPTDPIIPFTFNTTATQNPATRTFNDYLDFIEAITTAIDTYGDIPTFKFDASRDNEDYQATEETTITIASRSATESPQQYNDKVIFAISTNGLISSTTNFAGGFGTANSTNPSNNINYIFEPGDRLNIYYRANGEYIGKLDIEIKGFEKSRYLKIPYDPSFIVGTNILGKGTFIEIFRKPQTPTVADNPADYQPFYYEMGECYPVTNPHAPSRQFSKKDFIIWEGDTHKLRGVIHYATSMRMQGFDIYSMNPNSQMRSETWEKGDGRPNFVPAQSEEVLRKKTSLKWSGNYITGTRINNLCSFDALNETILSPEFGAIKKLQIADNSQAEGNVMLSIHEAQIVSNYIQEKVIKNPGGGQQIVTSDTVVGTSDPLMNGVGCQNPESVIQNDGRVYGVDALRGYVWRYSNDGLTILSDIKNREFFHAHLAAIQKSGKKYVISGGYDPYFGLYNMSINIYSGDVTLTPLGSGQGVTELQITETFNERSRMWMSPMSYRPEVYGKINNDFFSFKDGQLWLHYSNTLNANFYGVQYDSYIEGVFNENPDSVKIVKNIAATSDHLWECPSITNNYGQESELLGLKELGVAYSPPQDFILQEGVYKAAILRDKNTPNMPTGVPALAKGDVLRAQAFKFRFKSTVNTKSAIYYVDIEYMLSNMTNKV
jgi:hypothetical protein